MNTSKTGVMLPDLTQPHVLICIEGGRVVGVQTNVPLNAKVLALDYDAQQVGHDEERDLIVTDSVGTIDVVEISEVDPAPITLTFAPYSLEE